MKKITVAALATTALLGARAETTNAVSGDNRIVVTATRHTAPIRSVAANPSVITAQDIENGHYTSIPEVLQKEAGVFFRNFADNPSQAAVDLRGFGGDAPFGRTLILLNGRKLNRSDMATVNWAQIPMQAVERIEVIRGANSVLYGDQAVGGVINIMTKDAPETPETSLQVSAGSHRAVDQSLVTSGSLKGLGYVATFGHQSGDGYRDRSRYDTRSGSLRLSGNIHDSFSAYAEASAVKEQHQLPGALTMAEVKQNRRQSMNPEDSAVEEYYNVQVGIQALLGEQAILNLDGGFSRKNLEADFPSFAIPAWFIPPVYYDFEITTYSLSPKLTVLTPVFGLDNELVIGTDLSRETLNTKKFNDPNRARVITDTKVEKKVVGGYIADTLHLTDSLLLNGGYRWEKNEVDVRHKGGFTPYDDSIRHTEEAWQASLTWLPTDTIKLFTGVETTYRYPFFDEQAIYSGWGDAFNQNLKPETGIGYEAGIEIMPMSNLVLQATVFQTDMENEITWGGTSNTNLDETVHRGIELSAAYQNDYFALNAFYTWLQSEFTEGMNNGNEIPWVPQNQFEVNLALFVTDALTVNTHVSYVSTLIPLGDNDNNSTEQQSEHAIVDLLLQYELPFESCEATLFAGIDNVFETEYYHLITDYGFGTGYYPAPERTWKAGLSIEF